MRIACCIHELDRKPARLLNVAFALALIATVSEASADASKLPPEVGYDYGQTATPRIGGMGGAQRASSNSTDALFVNPANIAATRVYHVGALGEIWPEARRQTYGIAIVDSIVSASRLAGGLSGSYTSQDPSGVDRSAFDVRLALAYPFSEYFYAGATARYLSLKQSGYPSGLFALQPSAAAGGLKDKAIVQQVTFDAGLTAKPVKEFALSLVGYNLTDPGVGFLPFMVGGGAAYETTELTVEADALADFTTYSSTTWHAMGGGELLVGDHVPLRAGYRWDQGRESHALSFGVGYVDQAYALELSVMRVVSGDAATAVLIGFRYHVESAGLMSEETD